VARTGRRAPRLLHHHRLRGQQATEAPPLAHPSDPSP
jgi:hypothetical protein